jgi:NADH pyrophosphatase NudC (nudix superfamily)
MLKLKKTGGFYSLLFSEKEALELGLEANTDYELNKAKDGIWVLINSNKISIKSNSVELKIIQLLSETDLKERVQGVFESKLNEEEKKVFKKMLEEKKVFEFKLNEKYRKAIYKLPEEINQIKQKISSKETEKSAEKNYLILSNENQAKIFSMKNEKELKEGMLRGLKCFDGTYCIIKNNYFEKISPKIIEFLKKNKETTVPLISKELNMPEDLIKVICEFLKEDGMLLEKRKGIYKFIP